MFPKIGGFYPQNGWLKIMEHPIKIDDLGVPFLFGKHLYIFLEVIVPKNLQLDGIEKSTGTAGQAMKSVSS